MWTLSDLDGNDSRVLCHDDPRVDANLVPADQNVAARAPTRADFQRALLDILARNNHAAPPTFTNDDLDRLRAALGGAQFQPPPQLKRQP